MIDIPNCFETHMRQLSVLLSSWLISFQARPDLFSLDMCCCGLNFVHVSRAVQIDDP